jgi:hypothetical protein
MWTLESWDPDMRPADFSDGRSHALYELFCRLRAKGADVTIGPSYRGRPEAVVAFSKDLNTVGSLRFVLRFGATPTLIIESDWPPHLRIPVRGTLTVPPRPGPPDPSRRWLPLLPQRGLVPREPSRVGAVRGIGYKGDPTQLPAFMKDPSFLSRVAALGITASEADVYGGREQWHDFSSVDAALCLRDPRLPTDHKPPTKLINAWAAGCIPLVSREAAYLDLATDGVDALFVESEDELIARLDRLAADSSLVARLEEGVAVRQSQYSVDHVMNAWESAIADVAQSPGRRGTPARVQMLLYWTKAQIHNLHTRLAK